MKSKLLIYTAKMFSLIFAPFYLPVLGFLVLFVFSYMKLLPIDYKLTVLTLVYLLTTAIPLTAVFIYRRMNGLHRRDMTRREMRTVSYGIFFACYISCYIIMVRMHMPHFMLDILKAAMSLQLVCWLINFKMRISTHAAAAAAVVGALLGFSIIFSFNPIWWLCLALLCMGCVGTSRLILRRHSLREVCWGMAVGFVCGFLATTL